MLTPIANDILLNSEDGSYDGKLFVIYVALNVKKDLLTLE